MVIRAKIFIQSTWLQGLEWDTPLGPSEAESWRTFQEELPELAAFRMPRWYRITPSAGTIEVHGFADASERAFAAAIYLRTKANHGIKGWGLQVW